MKNKRGYLSISSSVIFLAGSILLSHYPEFRNTQLEGMPAVVGGITMAVGAMGWLAAILGKSE